jgi:hypothetical protein
MGVRLQRHLGPVESISAAQFHTHLDKHTPGRMCDVAICCPACGGVSEVPETHAIDTDGRVTPAWKCPTPTCPFFDYLTLDTWGEPQW